MHKTSNAPAGSGEGAADCRPGGDKTQLSTIDPKSKLARSLERIAANGRQWFERHPKRRWRIRPPLPIAENPQCGRRAMNGETVFITPASGGNIVTWSEECGIMREPIVAWRHIVSTDQSVYTWPITVEGTDCLKDNLFAIETPGRGATFKFVVPHCASFETLDELIQYWRGS